MGLFGGKKVTEWGYRTTPGNRDHWCKDKAQAKREVARRNRKTGRTGETAKLIQRQVPAPEKDRGKVGTAVRGKLPKPKDPCSGGRCTKRGNICKKHFRAKTGRAMDTDREWTLDGIHARWDEEGHRWG